MKIFGLLKKEAVTETLQTCIFIDICGIECVSLLKKGYMQDLTKKNTIMITGDVSETVSGLSLYILIILINKHYNSLSFLFVNLLYSHKIR